MQLCQVEVLTGVWINAFSSKVNFGSCCQYRSKNNLQCSVSDVQAVIDKKPNN